VVPGGGEFSGSDTSAINTSGPDTLETGWGARHWAPPDEGAGVWYFQSSRHAKPPRLKNRAPVDASHCAHHFVVGPVANFWRALRRRLLGGLVLWYGFNRGWLKA